MVRGLFICLAIFGTASLSGAYTIPDDYAEYEITASRLQAYRLPLSRVGSAVTVIDREEIDRSGAENVQRILEQKAGFNVFDENGNAVENKVSMRGFKGGDDIVVVVDGIRVNDPNGNTVAWNLIPLESIERIEIVRGGSTSLYGPNALSGVIKIWTRRGAETAGRIKLGAGSHANRDMFVSWGSSTERFDGTVNASAKRGKGYRDNSEVSYEDFGGEFGIKIGDGRYAVQVQRNEDKLGRSGELTLPQMTSSRRSTVKPLDYSEFALTRIGFSAEHPLLGGDLNLRFGYRDRNRLTHSTSITTGTRRYTNDDLHSRSGVAEWSRKFGEHGFSVMYDEKYDNTGVLDRNAVTNAVLTDRNIYEHTRSGAARLDLALGKNWTLTGTVRYDNFKIENRDNTGDTTQNGNRKFDEFSPGGALVWSPELLGREGRIFVGISRGYRPPNGYQLYAAPGWGSNPNLQPAKLQTLEAGIFVDKEEWDIGVTLFEIDMKNEIDFSNVTWMNENIAKSERKGIEAYLGIDFTERLKLTGDFTWISAHVKENPSFPQNVGKHIPQVPGFQSSTTLLWMPGKFSVGLTHRFVGKQWIDFDDDNNQPQLPAFNVFDLTASYKPINSMKLELIVRNIGDRKYITRGIDSFDAFWNQTNYYNPAPEREYIGSLTWEF